MDCPNCDQPVEDQADPGEWVTCSHCEKPFQVPQAIERFDLSLGSDSVAEKAQRVSRGPRVDPLHKYRVCKRCPDCGCPDYEQVRAATLIAFVADRACKACQTRYTPPTPIWAALIFAVVGLGLGAGCLVGVIFGVRDGRLLMICINAPLALLGLLIFVYGVRCFREKVVEPPERQD